MGPLSRDLPRPWAWRDIQATLTASGPLAFPASYSPVLLPEAPGASGWAWGGESSGLGQVLPQVRPGHLATSQCPQHG